MFQLPFATFMMRISFEAVPQEIEESALVDGAGTFGVLRQIMLPAARPGHHHGRAVRVPRRVERLHRPADPACDETKAPLPLAIATLRQQTMGVIDYGATEAGVVVMAIPS